ncbi:hypothetical protein ACWEQ2_40125, partial [Streptomyces sp. NPDC004096]
ATELSCLRATNGLLAGARTDARPTDLKHALRNLPGTMPSFREVCERSSISGVQNSGSMAAFPQGFVRNMRLMDKDAYWLNTSIKGDCVAGTGSFMHCAITTN